MNLPKQAPPVSRQVSTMKTSAGVTASDCGCPIKCLGACVLGHCVGVCL
jgi:hypothetical protein